MTTAYERELEKELSLLREQNKELVFVTGKLASELQDADQTISELRDRINELEKWILDTQGKEGQVRCRSL